MTNEKVNCERVCTCMGKTLWFYSQNVIKNNVKFKK